MRRMMIGLLALLIFPLAALGAEKGAAHEPAWWLVGLFTLEAILVWVFTRGRYHVRKGGEYRPAFQELQEFGYFLLSGAVIAQFWVHGNGASYHATMEAVLFTLPRINQPVTIHFFANEIIMVFFFGIAAKELSEAVLSKDGPLRGRKSLLPIMACLGGVIMPAVIFVIIASPERRGAWGVPCATDIAFAWLGARMIWGRNHPAVTFLLALAIVDDFIGMGIIAIFYPQRQLQWMSLGAGIGLLATGTLLAFTLGRLSRFVSVFRNPIAFIPSGVLCWLGLHFAGLHAALALVFVVPCMPMGKKDPGFFTEPKEPTDRPAKPIQHQASTLDRFEHYVRPGVDFGLFFFGLVNAGVAWIGSAAWDQDSWAVFLGLGIGKTAGIPLFTIAGFWLFGLIGLKTSLPDNPETGERLGWRDLPIIGCLGAMGFTVALFVADAAGTNADVAEAAGAGSPGGFPSLKLGAMASFAFLAIAVVLGKLFLRPRRNDESD